MRCGCLVTRSTIRDKDGRRWLAALSALVPDIGDDATIGIGIAERLERRAA
jgi:hypothetical protein